MNEPVVIGDCTLYLGDCRARLAEIAADSIDCVVTSPPYLGLRDYGIEPVVWPWGRICLDEDGKDCEHEWGESAGRIERKQEHKGLAHTGTGAPETRLPGLKERHECIASQGQFCRRCNAWRGSLGLEPTPELYVAHMVEVFRVVRRVLKPGGTVWLNIGDSYASTPNGRSAADTKAAGKDDRTFRDKPMGVPPGLKPKDLMMMPARTALALQADGWWLRSEIVWAKPNPMPESTKDRPTSAHEKIFLLTKSARYWYDADAVREEWQDDSLARAGRAWNNTQRKRNREADPNDSRSYGHDGAAINTNIGRNLRNVWTIATQPYPEAHFATFPIKLAERCILAGCPPGGIVLDPFGGAGTVGVAAARLARRSALIEISDEYTAMIRRRIEDAYRQGDIFRDAPAPPKAEQIGLL